MDPLVARLHRRAGFGLSPADAAAASASPAAEAQRLLDPDAHGVAAAPDPWAGVDLSGADGSSPAGRLVGAWVAAMAASPRPLLERMAWIWHGHFVVSVQKVRSAAAVADLATIFRTSGFGPFPALVRAVTTDAAMLAYLDGNTNTGRAPNENYGRELLELFTLGRGAYGEADVQAGAHALSGWVARPSTGVPVSFVASRHDATPRTFLGRPGVHDVDTVVAAIAAHPALPTFVAGKVGRTLLGPDLPRDAVDRLAHAFAAAGLDTRALWAAAVQELLAGTTGGPIVSAPVHWLVMALRATGATVRPVTLVQGLRAAGQLPAYPPNVGGWPSGTAWLSSATMVARFDLASAVAAGTPDGPVLDAAGKGDAEALAASLGLDAPFGPATRAALAAVRAPASRLVVALTSPEMVLV